MTKEDLIKIVTDEVIKELQNFTFPANANSVCDTDNNSAPTNTTTIFEKKLLTEKIALEIVKSNTKELKVKKTTIITPAAVDLLSTNKIRINRF
jgi:hypothetical protein